MNGGMGITSPLAARQVASPNFGARRGGRGVDMLVLHYTGCPSAESALLWMCSPDSQVSAHYLVDTDGEIMQLVGEEARAWHAGSAFWAGEADINSCSIGIEIQNPGHDQAELEPYPQEQIAAVIALSKDIIARHGIPAHRVLGHSDVAPVRKADPGEHFPWARLAAAGVGLWVGPSPAEAGEALWPDDKGEAVRALQERFRAFGYGVPVSGGYCPATEHVVRAFQRHFRPERVDGVADASTVRTLERLLAVVPLA